jgi:hypothetical protein
MDIKLPGATGLPFFVATAATQAFTISLDRKSVV